MPHEEAAATAAAAAAVVQQEREAAATASVGDIPGADASWEDVAGFIAKVQEDIAADNMGSWRADSHRRANCVDQLCGAWADGKSLAEKKHISNFHVDFKIAAFS